MKIPKKRTKLISFRVTEQVKKQWDAMQLHAKRSDDDLNLVIANGIAAMLKAAAKQLKLDVSKIIAQAEADAKKLADKAQLSASSQTINGASRD